LGIGSTRYTVIIISLIFSILIFAVPNADAQFKDPKAIDSDKDGIPDVKDNCPNNYNPDQRDTDGDGIGDACDPTPKGDVRAAPTDSDKDGIPDTSDNCPKTYNPDQTDSDRDGIGDACDLTPKGDVRIAADSDKDGIPDTSDNCPKTYNPDQTDSDRDGIGDACDLTPKGDVRAAAVDTTPPFIVVPSDIVVDAAQKSGAYVKFQVTAFDNVDDIITPFCTKSSGSLFAVGTTTVTCRATDSSENNKQESFTVTVNPLVIVIPQATSLKIPSYVKDIAKFWKEDQVDDNTFVGAIEYMINTDIIKVPDLPPAKVGTTPKSMPSWIKTNIGYWTDGFTTDTEFGNSIQWLVGKGIIDISKKGETASLPETSPAEPEPPSAPPRTVVVSLRLDSQEIGGLTKFFITGSVSPFDPNTSDTFVTLKIVGPQGNTRFDNEVAIDQTAEYVHEFEHSGPLNSVYPRGSSFSDSTFSDFGLYHVSVQYSGTIKSEMIIPVIPPMGPVIIVAGVDKPDAPGKVNDLAGWAYQTMFFETWKDVDGIYLLYTDLSVDLLVSDFYGPSADALPTKANLQYAIENWALDKFDLADPTKTPLTIYIISGIGGWRTFNIGDNEIVQASELVSWLENLKTGITQRQMAAGLPETDFLPLNIILDSRRVGSFILPLNTLNGQSHPSIIMTSTGDGALPDSRINLDWYQGFSYTF